MADPLPQRPSPEWRRQVDELASKIASVLDWEKPDPLLGLAALASVIGTAVGVRIAPQGREEILQRLLLQMKLEADLAAPTRTIALMVSPQALEARRKVDAAEGQD